MLVELEKDSNLEKIAYLSNLISFYIFEVITPSFSEEIALFYAEKSLNYNSKAEYKERFSYLNKGN